MKGGGAKTPLAPQPEPVKSDADTSELMQSHQRHTSQRETQRRMEASYLEFTQREKRYAEAQAAQANERKAATEDRERLQREVQDLRDGQ